MSLATKLRSKRTPPVSAALKQEFDSLTVRWTAGTAFTSSDTDVVLHPCYQRIIGIRDRVLPLILVRLRHRAANRF